ncbi:MAG: alpha/beta hydrolase [Legionella sp.]|nr:MAG: alpha/beta hydrolase [Legionella sp.]
MKKNSFLGISEEGFHTVAYTEWGSAEPGLPTVICVHGYSRNGRDFDALASYLSMTGRHVYCPDVVGRGDSSWFKKAQHYTFTQYSTDMTTLIARTQAHQIDWIGTSMGGIIGMMLAALPNSPIRRLILNDVGAQIPLHGLKKLAKCVSKTLDFPSLQAAQDYFKLSHSEFGPLTDAQWETLTQNSVEQRGNNLFRVKIDPAIKNPKSTTQFVSDFLHHPHRALEGLFYDIDLWYLWQQIRCPVLIIHGAHSELLTTPIINKMRKIHDQTELMVIEDAGHAPALLDRRQHELITHWLDSTLPNKRNI